mgnify:CR=1 FL=1
MPVIGFPVGEQHIWSIASMYIVADKMDKLTEEELISSGFIQSQSSNTRDCYSLFSREYAWSPGYNAEFAISEDDDNRVPINAVPASINVLWEEEYDASQKETTSFMIPAGNILAAAACSPDKDTKKPIQPPFHLCVSIGLENPETSYHRKLSSLPHLKRLLQSPKNSRFRISVILF